MRALAVAAAALGLLVLPGTAQAQFFPFQEEPGAGITMTGSGLAPVEAPSRPSESSIQRAVDAAHPTAVDRAVRDARRRAAAIAEGAGLELGEIAALELDDTFPQFGPPRAHCRPRRDKPPRCRVPEFTAAVATATFEIVGGAEGAEGTRTVSAYGSGSVEVEPENPRSNSSIRRAIREARLAVIPAAAALARRNVETAARSTGMTLGGVVSVSEQQLFYPYDASFGRFGPGRFCGVVRRSRVRRDPATGRFRVIRTVSRRRCFFPRTLTLRLEATFEAR
jgi:uncharacterized protein DUF541